ncbi:hypothetical protein ACRALDRAFT_2042164 [Sodiomyces alcalophilus JCM 7366]|uniref:uncharacterized protein n=1 Tax=Sodiomyces alcalophilus JCM 7366 TaxID=591952 RepID=UPI0039B60E78
MDELRFLTRSTFGERSEFKGTTKLALLRLIKLTATAHSVRLQPPADVSQDQLFREVEETSSSDSVSTTASAEPETSLQLIIVPRAEDDSIGMTDRSSFLDLFDRFDIDPIVLQQIALTSYGFHHYDEPYRNAYSFYIGTYVYSLAWSYNPTTMRTNAILLLRTTPVLDRGTLVFARLHVTLHKYKAYARTPFFLAFMVYIHLCRMSQEAVFLTVRDLRRIESMTGHGPGLGAQSSESEPSSSSQRRNIHKLSSAAQKVATIRVHLANLLRHDAYLKTMAAYLETPRRSSQWNDLLGHPDLAASCDADFDYLFTLMPAMKKLTSDLETSLIYLQTRAEGQSSVIFSMMTHEDAARNTELAALNTELATAATKDSKAMKSIAMMTMFFLPGTFFASVFSMESLPTAAAEQFWIFWVCAVASTLVVFVVWKYHHKLTKAKLKRKNGEAPQQKQLHYQQPGRACTEDTLTGSLAAELRGLGSV